MKVCVAVHFADLLVVNLAEPIVGSDGAGVREDQSAHGVGDGGVFLADLLVNDLAGVVRRDLQGQKVDHIGGIGDIRRVEGLHDGVGNAGDVELSNVPISLDDSVYGVSPLFLSMFL